MVALVIARRILALAMIFGVSATACTAIVLGIIDDSDAGTDAGSSGASGTSGTGTSGTSGSDECSLLDRYQTGKDSPPNRCSECIKSKCASDVEYACNRAGEQHKSWFGSIAQCAQSPWVRYPEPGSSGQQSWGCGTYKDEPEFIEGEDEQAKKRNSEICVHDNCVNGAGADCRLCEVSVKGEGSDETFLLRDDKCGKCFSDNCQQTIIDCCDSQVIPNWLVKCANTKVGSNKTDCRKFENIVDGGELKEIDPQNKYSYGQDDLSCAARLGQCFRDNDCAAGCK